MDFGGSLTSLRVVTIGPLAVALIALFLVAERVRPAQLRPLVARGHRHDVLFTVLNVVVVLPLVTALTLSFADVVRRAAPWVVLPRFGVVPRWGAIILILVAMDGCNWLVHLANHRVRMLWRFHELHHSQEDMNVLTVFRTHPLIHVSYVLAVVPALVLLANGELPTLLLVIYGGAVAFAHSNTNLSFGPLERVFVSPNYHRIHHRLARSPRREPRFHADDLGPAFPSGGVSDARDDQGRYGAAATTPQDRTTGISSASPHGLRRATRRTVSPAERTRRARLHPGTRSSLSTRPRRGYGDGSPGIDIDDTDGGERAAGRD